MPFCDAGYSVGFRHSTHSAYGGPPAAGGVVAPVAQYVSSSLMTPA